MNICPAELHLTRIGAHIAYLHRRGGNTRKKKGRMSFKEGYLEYPDGLKVRYRINEHTKEIPAVFIHGAGERLETYDYIFPYFETAGIALNALELRGHGLSGGRIKLLRDFSLLAKDLKRFISGNLQNRPVYLVATGAGASLAVRIASDQRFTVRGIVFVSPLIEAPVPSAKRFSISCIARFLPGIFVATPFAHAESCACDDSPARVPGFPAGFVRALFAEMKRAKRDISLLRNFPVLLVLGEEDPVLDIAKTETLFKCAFADSQNLRIVTCKKCGHTILTDKDRLDFVEKITRWILKVETGQD
jgi:alpha-beta hydrolase superfamily lysophospholipase